MPREPSEPGQPDGALEAACKQLQQRFEQQAAELRAARESLRREIAERSRAEASLREARDELERQVERRTSELAIANGELKAKIEDQTRIAEALRESEERYRTLVELAPDSIATLDLKGRITSVNAANIGLQGYDVEEVLGKPFWKTGVFHVRDVLRYLRFFCSVIRGRSSGPIELVCHSKDGTPHTVEAHFGVLRKDGRIVGLQVISRNVTERKQTQQALAAAKERWERTFNAVPDLVAILDTHHRIVRVNRSMADAMGTTPEACVGLPCYRYVHGTEEPPSFCPHTKVLADGSQHTVELHEKRLGGDFSATVSPLFDSAGTLVGGVHVARDVTERKRAEGALRREKDFVEKLIQAAPTIVLVLDERGRILRCNPFMEKLTGYRLDDIRGKDWFTIFIPDSHRPATRTLLAEMVSRCDGLTNTNPIVTKEGRLREIEWNNRVLTDEAGNVVAVLAIGHDVTELKAAQERALQSERLAAIGEMVAGLAHESRNALQRSQACLEMLALEIGDRAEALDLVSRIQIAQDHLHHLYEEVRSYAAPIVLHRQPVRLAELIDGAWSQSESSRRGRVARLDAGRHIREGSCVIDRAAMQGVLRNLFENCLTACSDPVEILVTGRETEIGGRPAVEIAVRDNGPGLDPEQRKRIFDPFYTTKAHGTGLGMAIAKRIVEAHGGRIAVGPGPGAEILVTLPLE